jgi:PhnB protein
MALEIYLNFNGNCREAVEFYAKVFEADIQPIMTFGDAPDDPVHPLSEDAKKLIMHTFLVIGGSKVMFSDVMPGMPFTAGNNISLVLPYSDLEKIKSCFNQLKAGGSVEMELQETFWSKCYGFLTDRFGIGWQLSYQSPDVVK